MNLKTVCLLLGIAIAFVAITSPKDTASHAQQESVSISMELYKEVLDSESRMHDSLVDLTKALGSAVEVLERHDVEIGEVRYVATQEAKKLEATKAEVDAVKSEVKTEAKQSPAKTADDGVDACRCAERFANHEARIAALESRPVASSGYGSVSGGTGYGSSGGTSARYSQPTTQSGGYGSSGGTSVASPGYLPAYAQPVVQQPIQPMQSPQPYNQAPLMVDLGDGCYVDLLGQTVCPGRVSNSYSQVADQLMVQPKQTQPKQTRQGRQVGGADGLLITPFK